MYYGDVVLYNDEQRDRLRQAYRRASQDWRFRSFKSLGDRVWIGTASALDATFDALCTAALVALDATRRGIERARDWQPPALMEQ